MFKKCKLFLIIFLLLVCSCLLTGCDLIGEITGGGNSNNKYNDELQSITGKWVLLNDNDTYFQFDGSNKSMTVSYFEDGTSKYTGNFRAIYRGVGSDVGTPLTLIVTRSDKEKEDWISCYTENFDDNFTQFTIFDEEEDLGIIDGTVYTHIYRISELPYKMGTYILEGNEYKQETNNYYDGNYYVIPNGTYSLDSGESFTFFFSKPKSYERFQFKKGDTVIEGVCTIHQDKKTIYLYIEHDPYSKVTKADKEFYDTTFSINYPPDFYLRGDFSNKDNIIINDLYHHAESQTKIEDSIWTFGTYNKN